MKTIKALAAAALFALPLAGCAGDGFHTDRVITEADTGKKIRLSQGQTLEVQLSSSAGTGHAWRLERTPATWILTGGSSQDSLADRPGAPITTTYTFQALGYGKGDLAFTYKRPWEPDGPGDKKVVFRVDVR